MIVFKQSLGVVRNKLYHRTALLVARIVNDTAIFHQMALLESNAASLIFTPHLHYKLQTQGIDSFGTHTIQADRFFESFGVVLTTRIKNRHGFHHFTEWNTASVVANANALAQ